MDDKGKAGKQIMEEQAGRSRRAGKYSPGAPAEDGPRRSSTEEVLLRDEHWYRQIVDTALEGIWVLDEEYLTAFVNTRMADMLGYEPKEMVGRRHDSFLFEEDLPDLAEKTSLRRRGISSRYERRLRHKDGTTVWAQASASPILDEEGRFQGSFAMFTDITERKHAEEALAESARKFREIFENAVEGIFQVRPDGSFITVNPAMARIFGYSSPKEMVSTVTNIGHQIYTNPDDRHAFRKILEENGIVRAFEARFYRKDGSVLWGSVNVRAVKDPADGQVLYHEGIMEDITARKEAEEALRKSEENYRDIFENAVEGIYQVTPEGGYLSVNPALARIHGFDSPEEMVASVTDIAHQLYVDPSRRAHLRRLMEEEGSIKNFEIMMRRKDGSLHWVSNSAHAIRDAGGRILYYEGTVEDITTRKFAEEELKQLRAGLAGTIRVLSRTVEIKDPGAPNHQKRVSNLAHAIAKEMELSNEMAEHIRIAGLVHDIGKLSIPSEILSKPAALTDMEFGLMKTHPRTGFDILKDADLPAPVAEMVLQHHERLDGSGYPRGLRGAEILLEARILAVADVVEAVSSRRPYRPALGVDAALLEIKKNRGILYDPEVAEVCTKLLKKKGFKLG